MKTTSLVSIALGILLASCAAPPASNAPATFVAMAPAETESALQSAVIAERQRAGLSGVRESNALDAMARDESNAAAAAGGLPPGGSEYPRSQAGFARIGKMRGALKDRGPATGAGFVDYWAHDSRPVLLGKWTHIGKAISRTADGRLIAVVIFGTEDPAGGPNLLLQAAP